MASIQVDDEQVEAVTKPTTEKPELNSPAIDEAVEAPAKTTETSPYFDEEDEQEDEVKEDKPEDKDDEEEDEDKENLAPSDQIIDEDGVEPAFSGGGASRSNEFSEEEDDAHHDHADD